MNEDEYREGTGEHQRSMGIWAELRAWEGQQTNERNHASAIGRTAGGNGDVCPAQEWRWGAEQETSWMGIRYQRRKSGWRELRKRSGMKGTAWRSKEQADWSPCFE